MFSTSHEVPIIPPRPAVRHSVPEEARKHVDRALELEAKAGVAVLDGKVLTAESLRSEARESWRAARELGL